MFIFALFRFMYIENKKNREVVYDFYHAEYS